MSDRFKISNEFYIFDECEGKHLDLKDACDRLNEQNTMLKAYRRIVELDNEVIDNLSEQMRELMKGDYGMNVGELKKQLENVDDNLPVELMVNYDNCWHMQRLGSVDVARPWGEDNWVVLRGEKE